LTDEKNKKQSKVSISGGENNIYEDPEDS